MITGMSLCQQKCREAVSSSERCWHAPRLDGEGSAVSEEGPLTYRLNRRKINAEKASEGREKQGGTEDHYNPQPQLGCNVPLLRHCCCLI